MAQAGGLVSVVSDEHRRHAGLRQRAGQLFEEGFAGGLVQAVEGFVQENNLRLQGEGTRQARPLRMESGRGRDECS